jgi:hypothetical protein
MLSFLLAMGDLWIAALTQIGGYGWYTLRTLSPQLAVHLLITIVCVKGWAGESFSINKETALQVWLYGLGTFVSVDTASVFCGFVSSQP